MDTKGPLAITKARPEDRVLDRTLRPRKLAEYIGQSQVKENLQIFLDAARKRKEPIDHVLLFGPPGLGKTTLAHVIAAELGVGLRITSGPALERAGDLAAILTNLNDGDVLFIDEIHRLGRVIEEVLYPAMEDHALDLVVGKGPSARTMRIDLPRFAIVGATTRMSLLSPPLRDRFDVVYRLNFYSNEEMEEIVRRSSRLLNVPLADKAIQGIAHRARRTPRVANRLLKRVRDFADVRQKSRGTITAPTVEEALTLLDIDPLGLDQLDRRILETIIEKFQGGPVGLGTLAAAIAEDRETIEDVYEPFLLRVGFLARTPRGRVVTPQAYAHLGRPVPAPGQVGGPRLF
ncbi:MAG: Holliday junction branch migration DNA helicase RuvB [Candidatus Kerfeldbacteria bacterium]|nr:Holliday junction branch migration DNA helicase RuvB [Candidatus Kerfeldbacteria bacterium]